MADVATHVRIFEAEPSDDFVTKRVAAVAKLAAKFTKDRNVDVLVTIADGTARACHDPNAMRQALKEMVEQAVRDESTAFICAGNELQLAVVALLALDQAILGGKPAASLSIADVLASATWLAFGAQASSANPKVEALRAEILGHARTLCLSSASKARQRSAVGEIKVGAFAPDLSDANAKLQEAVEGPLNALRENAILDREELDFLWWALGDYSVLGKGYYSTFAPPLAAVAAGLDAAQNLRRLPAESHKHVISRHVRPHEPMTLGEVVAAVGPASAALGALTGAEKTHQFPAVYSLLAALDGRPDPAAHGEKLGLADWAARALAEAGFLRVTSLLPGAKV